MSQLDYADWNRVDQWIGNPFVHERGVNHSNLTTFGPFFMGEWAALSVLLQAFPAGTPVMVHRVDWWQDQAMTQLIAEQTLVGRAGGQVLDCLPSLGPWVSVTFQPGGANVNSNVTLQPRRDIRARCSPIDNLIIAGGVSTAVAAGGFVAVTVATSISGRAVLAANANTANWSVNLWSTDSTGAKQALLAVCYREVLGALATSSLIKATFAPVSLPAAPSLIELVNSDVIAGLFSYSLTVDDSW